MKIGIVSGLRHLKQYRYCGRMKGIPMKMDTVPLKISRKPKSEVPFVPTEYTARCCLRLKSGQTDSLFLPRVTWPLAEWLWDHGYSAGYVRPMTNSRGTVLGGYAAAFVARHESQYSAG